jgi:transcriptional regulator with XRE-family HTH domain
MDVSKLQQELFQLIKTNIPGHLSVTEEIARVLDVSVDSVYRRMRGEKTISLDELQTLCDYYNISVDQLLNIQSDGFFFQGNLVDESTFDFDKYINSLLQNMVYFNSFKQKEIYGLYKDVPPFHNYHFHEIAAFKRFVWQKTLLHISKLKNQKFSFDDYPQELFLKEQKILELYNQMKSVEIWNFETINSIIRQIEYYRDNQIFKSDADAYKLYDAIENLLNHLEAQAAAGYKFKYDDPEHQLLGEYNVYLNEVLLGNNEYVLILDGKKIAFISNSTINYMGTRNVAFTENMYKSMNNFMKRSTLISSASEKERSKLFRILYERIARRKDALTT